MDDMDESMRPNFENNILQQISGPKGACSPGHDFTSSLHANLFSPSIKAEPQQKDGVFKSGTNNPNLSRNEATSPGSRLSRPYHKTLENTAACRDDSVDSMINNDDPTVRFGTPHQEFQRMAIGRRQDTKSPLSTVQSHPKKRSAEPSVPQNDIGMRVAKSTCLGGPSCSPGGNPVTPLGSMYTREQPGNAHHPSSPITSLPPPTPKKTESNRAPIQRQQKFPSTIKTPGTPVYDKMSDNPLPVEPDEEFPVNELIRQPEPCIMSPPQLIAEVLGIYAAIEKVERKCIAIDQGQMGNPAKRAKLSDHNWQALTAVHRTLLYEHYDFLIASQQPTAPDEVKRMASERQMPLRLWRFAIHSYLEVLRLHLPESMDFMVNYIMIAYQMLALLFETVPTFEVVWTECLGDLARYRMAIENKDIRDREIWTGVAHYWYLKASEKQPDVGRLYHHLGILARPRALQQVYYYTKSLTCVQPFQNAKESIKTIFDPALGRSQQQPTYATELDEMVVKVHAVMFNKTSLESAYSTRKTLLSQLAPQIEHAGAKWREYGVFVAVTNISAWFSYGFEQDALRQLLMCKPTDNDLAKIVQAVSTLHDWFTAAITLSFDVLRVSLSRVQDPNVLPHVHLMLIFLLTLCRTCSTRKCMAILPSLIGSAPWEELATFLNKQTELDGLNNRTLEAGIHKRFLRPEREDVQPLPEDHLVRGLVWCKDHFPDEWFSKDEDEESRMLERPSTHSFRSERVLWTAIRVSQFTKQLGFDPRTRRFAFLS